MDAALSAQWAELETLRRFRRCLPLAGLQPEDRWPTDLSRRADHLRVRDVQAAMEAVLVWCDRQGLPRGAINLHPHTVADALLALRERAGWCRRHAAMPPAEEWAGTAGAMVLCVVASGHACLVHPMADRWQILEVPDA